MDERREWKTGEELYCKQVTTSSPWDSLFCQLIPKAVLVMNIINCF